jgi:hypothetical protein
MCSTTPREQHGTSCSRNIRRSRPCLRGLLSRQKEVSHNNGRKSKGSTRREGTRGGVRACRCALSSRSRLTRLTLLSLSNHSHPTLISLPSHSHLTPISLSSHSHLALVSPSSHSHLARISLLSHSHLTHISFSTRCRLICIARWSRSHLTLVLLLLQLLLFCKFDMDAQSPPPLFTCS